MSNEVPDNPNAPLIPQPEPQPSASIVLLQAGRSEADIAKDLKRRLLLLLSEVCLTMDNAQAAGLTVTFQLARDYKNTNVIASLAIAKNF